MNVKDIVEDAIARNKVAIFSKSWCTYCRSVKETLGDYVLQTDIKILELDRMEDGPAIQDYLFEKTGQSTVPNVFINAQHVGGNDAVQTAKASNQLKNLIVNTTT